MNYYEIWSCAVRLIKRWRFPVQSCHDQSEDVFLYRSPVHLYTSPYKTWSFLLKPVLFYPNSNSPQKKDIVTRAAF